MTQPSNDTSASLEAAEAVCIALLELDAWSPEHRDEYESDDPLEQAVHDALDKWLALQ